MQITTLTPKTIPAEQGKVIHATPKELPPRVGTTEKAPSKPVSSKFSLIKESNFKLDRPGSGEPSKINSKLTLEQCASKGGILCGHLKGLSKVASESNTVITIRPVNTLSTGLIEEGYPTKGMNIKGKSSNWGPMAGFICVDQGLSKLAGSDKGPKEKRESIEKFSHKVEDSIKLGKSVCEPATLNISSSRLEKLSEAGLVKGELEVKEHQIGSEMLNGIMLTGTPGKDAKAQNFFAEKVEDGSFEFKVQKGDKWEDLKILALNTAKTGESQNLMGITADYDLLFLAPELDDFSSEKDKLSFPEVTAQGVINKFSRNALSEKSAGSLPAEVQDSLKHVDEKGNAKVGAPKSALGKMDDRFGNSSKRGVGLINQLNEACDRVDRPVVHHGSDEGNPFSEETDNYPSTVLLPHAITNMKGDVIIPKIAIIENAEQMEELFIALKDANYAPRANPNWDGRVVSAKRTSFTNAKKALSEKLKVLKPPVAAEKAREMRFERAKQLFEGLAKRSSKAPSPLSEIE